MKTHLQREIEKLKNKVLSLSAEVENNFEEAFESLVNYNTGLAKDIIERDEKIDIKEVEIEEECLKIMALYQPVAADLRMVIALLKINNDVERIGDLACNLAEYTLVVATFPKIELNNTMRLMYEETKMMMKKCFDAVVNMDSSLAMEVCKMDDKVDDLNLEYINETENLMTNTELIKPLSCLISASKSIERTADCITNIAEDIYYMVHGRIIRHSTNEV